MKVAKLRTAIFVSQDPNSTFAEHRCFLNPRHSTDHEVFNPEVIVQTKDWECRLSKPTVGYELLGNERYGLLPKSLIAKEREYVSISQLKKNSCLLEYVLKKENIQSIWGFGMNKKPIHVFDIEIKNDLQVDPGFSIQFCDLAEPVGFNTTNFQLISEYASATHIGEIKQIRSYELSKFNEMTGTN